MWASQIIKAFWHTRHILDICRFDKCDRHWILSFELFFKLKNTIYVPTLCAWHGETTHSRLITVTKQHTKAQCPCTQHGTGNNLEAIALQTSQTQSANIRLSWHNYWTPLHSLNIPHLRCSPSQYSRLKPWTSAAAFFISIILGSAESDLYWSVGATFIQIIDESAFIHSNVCTFIQNRAIPPWIW
jgi:hypothetical protein